MNPRLKSSKKWTAFPAEFVQQIQDALRETFEEQGAQGEFIAEGRIYPEEILLRVGYIENKRLQQNNFEVSLDYKQDAAVDRIHDAIDVAAGMMADFFQSEGEVEFPRTWKDFEFENKVVYCQYSTVNTKLEAEADRLLGESADESLLKLEAEESEDEGAAEDADDDDEPPRDKNKLH